MLLVFQSPLPTTLKTALFNSSLRLPHLSTILASIRRSSSVRLVNILINAVGEWAESRLFTGLPSPAPAGSITATSTKDSQGRREFHDKLIWENSFDWL